MKALRDTILLDQPLVDDYTLTNNGYTNITLRWPDDGNRTRTFWPTDVLTIKVLRFSATIQNIKFKILASLDGAMTFTEVAIPETLLITGTPYTIELSKYYTALKIQVSPDSLNNFGTFSATLTGTNLPSSSITADLETQALEALVSTSANQVLEKTVLDNIKIDVDKIPSKGQAARTASLPVAFSTEDAAIIGAPTDASASVSVDEDTSARSHTSLLKGAKNLLIDISGYLSTLAGAVSSSKVNVNISSGNPSTTPDTTTGDLAKITTLTNILGPTAPIPLNISFADAAAQTIIAAPAAGSRIRITSLFLSAGTDVNVAMKSGSNLIGTVYGMAFAKDWVQPLKLGTAEAFILDAVTADQIYGQVCYYVEVV